MPPPPPPRRTSAAPGRGLAPTADSCAADVGDAGAAGPVQDRRAFLGTVAAGATACAGGLLGLAGCDEHGREEFFQGHFLELTPAELEQVIARLRRDFRARFGADFHVGTEPAMPGVLFGYGLDLSRCVGCRRCVHACVRENNLSRDPQVQWIRVLEMDKERGVDLAESRGYYQGPKGEGADERTPREIARDGIGLSTDMAEYHLSEAQKALLEDPQKQYPLYKTNDPAAPAAGKVPQDGSFYMPVACQQCRRPPCVKVCPVKATWQEPDGIVVVDYNWCIGCRYCMAACPYGARHFNWGEPSVPQGEINTDTHYLGNRPRSKGHVEKCTFCIQRVRKGRYPACVEICPVGSRKFGDLNDPNSEIRYIMRHKRVFILKGDLNTGPKFFYFYGH